MNEIEAMKTMEKHKTRSWFLKKSTKLTYFIHIDQEQKRGLK
jgi:hypothetical protein